MAIDIQTLYLRLVQMDKWLPASVVMPFYRAISEEGRFATVVLVCGFALFAFLTIYFE